MNPELNINNNIRLLSKIIRDRIHLDRHWEKIDEDDFRFSKELDDFGFSQIITDICNKSDESIYPQTIEKSFIDTEIIFPLNKKCKNIDTTPALLIGWRSWPSTHPRKSQVPKPSPQLAFMVLIYCKKNPDGGIIRINNGFRSIYRGIVLTNTVKDAIKKRNYTIEIDREIDSKKQLWEKKGKDEEWENVKAQYKPGLFHKPANEVFHRAEYEKNPEAFKIRYREYRWTSANSRHYRAQGCPIYPLPQNHAQYEKLNPEDKTLCRGYMDNENLKFCECCGRMFRAKRSDARACHMSACKKALSPTGIKRREAKNRKIKLSFPQQTQ